MRQASYTNDISFFLIVWTKLFRSQKLLDVAAGAKKFRCPEVEPEPEI